MKSILKQYNCIDLNNLGNFDIPSSLIAEWQSIIDLLANLAGANIGKIMEVEREDLKIVVSSQASCKPGDKMRFKNSGLYCEHVIQTGEMLYVPNALKSEQWKNSTSAKMNHICYLGFPIKYPNGKLFGTMCILDNKENVYKDELFKVMEKMRDLIESQLQLLYISFCDPLTNTYNRMFLNLKIEIEMERANKTEKPLSMLLLDVDKFKNINDEFGHVTGDEVLRSFADVLKKSVSPSHIVARYGGEEFVVLMPNMKLVDAVSIAESIRVNIEKSTILQQRAVTTSIGVACMEAGECTKDWYNRVDKALYYAKEHGRNQVMVFENGGVKSCCKS